MANIDSVLKIAVPILSGYIGADLEEKKATAKAKAQTLKDEKEARAKEKENWLSVAKSLDPTKTPDLYIAALQKAGMGNIDNLTNLSNSMQNTADYKMIGNVRIKRPGIKGTESMFNQGMMHLRSIDEQLADPNFRNTVVENIQNDPDGFGKQFYAYLQQGETLAREGYNKDMVDKYKDKYNSTTHTFDLSAFGLINVKSMAEYFGPDMENSREEIESKLINESVEPNPDTKPVALTVFTGNGTSRKVIRGFSNTEYSAIEEIAASQGLTVKKFLDNYTGAENFTDLRQLPSAAMLEQDVYKDMSDSDIADTQYSLLKDAIYLKQNGFGKLDLLAAGPQKRQELLAFLERKYADKPLNQGGAIDTYKAAVVLSFLMPTDEYFKLQPRKKPTFGKGLPETRTAPTKSGRAYLETEMGMPPAQVTEMQNSYKFSVETVGLLQRLYTLETEDLKDAQGFARGLKGFLAGIGVQAPQVAGVISNLFTSDDAGSKVLQGNYKKNLDGTETTKESLQDVVKKLNDEGALSIDLANISEADALKLTLAARMARAIDPSGRLSNQDFEVQLRRLGSSLLGDAGTVKRQLGVLATEFEGLARRNLIINKIATGGRINARKARILQADKQIREIMEYDVRVTGNVTAPPAQSQPKPPAGSTPEGYIEGMLEGKPVWIKVGAVDGPTTLPRTQ